MTSHLTAPDGVRLRVRDRGPHDPGTPAILLVHGWKGSHRLWDKTAVHLMDDHRVVAFDLRGMGESDKPADGYDFDRMAADVGAVIRQLELDDVTLVGWSMGCTVALSYLGLDGAGVSRVVLTNGPMRLTRAPDFPHAMSDAQFDGYLEELVASWPAGERAFQAESTLEGDGPLVDWLYAIALQTPLDAALAIVRAQAKLDMRATLAELTIPVLAAYAHHDPYYPTSLADWIAETAQDGRRVLFERSAHCTPIEEAATYAAAIADFAAGRL
ncbi:MAG: Alpha/beta hydrolase [Solirubrobacterales bacterium]|nr:Alpha/beta hydrolase [Solirubrobacterales bacterium]